MYQPYPSSGQGPAPLTPLAGPPQSVRTAVYCMYAGAALSAIQLIIGLITIASVKSAIREQYPQYTASQIHTAQVTAVAIAIVIGVLAVGLWLWMAWANGRGRKWARIVATVLFALNTIDMLALVSRPHTALGLVFNILVWLAGLGAVVLLWQRDSSAYFQARSDGPS